MIGVLTEKGQTGMGNDQDDIILAPSTTVLYRLKGGDRIDMIYVSATSLEDIDLAQEEVEEILRQEHDIDYGDDDDFQIRSQSEITEMASETSQTLIYCWERLLVFHRSRWNWNYEHHAGLSHRKNSGDRYPSFHWCQK